MDQLYSQGVPVFEIIVGTHRAGCDVSIDLERTIQQVLGVCILLVPSLHEREAKSEV